VFAAVTEGERVRLRPVTAADLGALMAFLNDADVNRWIALLDGPRDRWRRSTGGSRPSLRMELS
jgi:hypothetical protein